MCGIAGHVNWGGGADPDGVAAMVACLRHRGPDDEGLWISPDGRCALGHTRLSIIDLSPRGHQPMIDPATDNVIVFNGEIYNFRELRKSRIDHGDSFHSDSDTEVILALYRREGVAFLSRLRGMFALAIWDVGTRTLLLARDRVGKKPLFYSSSASGVLFASELAGLRNHALVDTTLDTEALELYLQLQAVPAPWSIHRGIRKLPPAHYALVTESGITIRRYWDVDYRPKQRLTESDALDALEEKLREAVRLRLIADVPLGALLSGGVDSSLVVALMSRLSDTPVNTFSIGFEDEKFNELPWAEQAARINGTRHHTEIARADVEGLLPLVAARYGEPFADSSAIPSFHVARLARRHVTVVLNGDGGDELMGGYPRYTVPAGPGIPMIASALGYDRLLRIAAATGDSRALHDRLIRLAVHVLSPEVSGMMIYTSFWHDRLRARLLGRSHHPALLPAWRREWAERAREMADSRVDRMLWIDNRTYLPDDLLVKVDIASMHCGLEARSPLLDHEVIEFAATLPSRLKVRGRTGKYLLKKLAERYFPGEFVHRPKMGFAIPVARWLRTTLRETTSATLGDRDLMDPLDTTVIVPMWNDFCRGATGDRDAQRMWALLMYGLWKRSLREDVAATSGMGPRTEIPSP